MKAYKGFNPDMTCRGFQYKKGETYTEEKANLCNSGFHACEDPIDCFAYYNPAESVFHEVKLDEVSTERDADSKVAAKKITIGAKIDIASMIKASIDFRFSKTTEEKGGQPQVTEVQHQPQVRPGSPLQLDLNVRRWVH